MKIKERTVWIVVIAGAGVYLLLRARAYPSDPDPLIGISVSGDSGPTAYGGDFTWEGAWEHFKDIFGNLTVPSMGPNNPNAPEPLHTVDKPEEEY